MGPNNQKRALRFTSKMTVGERSTVRQRQRVFGSTPTVPFCQPRTVANGSNRTSPGPLSRPFPTGRPHHRREKMIPDARPNARHKNYCRGAGKVRLYWHSSPSVFIEDACPDLNSHQRNFHGGAVGAAVAGAVGRAGGAAVWTAAAAAFLLRLFGGLVVLVKGDRWRETKLTRAKKKTFWWGDRGLYVATNGRPTKHTRGNQSGYGT
jgi:hypothetical protein